MLSMFQYNYIIIYDHDYDHGSFFFFVVGPIYNSTPYDMQTPRTSERLQRKRNRSFSLPSREKVLDSMLSGVKLKNMYSQKKIRQLRPRKLVNNFLRE